MNIEINHRWNDSVLFAHDCEENSLAITLTMALRAKADLIGANLRGADLIGANLRGANLSGSNLSGSNLSDSDLSGSDLRGSNLSGSDLTPVRDDIWAILSSAPIEVPALIDSLKSGRVDGSTYGGPCSCLVGTIAAARGVKIESLGSLKPNSRRPAERFFLGINKGDTPETNQFSKLALEWCEQWLNTMQSAFASGQISATGKSSGTGLQ